MNQPEDRALVEAVLAGEQAAYGKLYDRYAPLIRAICHDATRNVPDAQDLAQDVFLRAYERLSSLRKPADFGKWLVGIARMRCREWQRQQWRCRVRNAAPRAVLRGGPDPPNNGHIERLRQTIARLPEKERLALHAFYLQQRSAEETQRIVGLSRSGFYRALSRARKRLERALARELEDTP